MKQHLVKLFLFAQLMPGNIFVYSFPGASCFNNVLYLEKNACISNSFLQSSRKTYFRLLISWLG